jgi:hypothetical protein
MKTLTNYQLTNGNCLICSKRGKIENINDKEYYLCENHNIMIETDIIKLMDDLGDTWSRLNLKGDKVQRCNKLYELLGALKTIQFS